MRARTMIAGSLLLAVGVPSPSRGQHMALTGRHAPETPPAVDAAHARWPAPPARPSDRALAGDLPDQKTGPMRARVVHDICIGCDR